MQGEMDDSTDRVDAARNAASDDPVPTIGLDRGGAARWANPAWIRVSGVDDPDGRAWLRSVHPDDHAVVMDHGRMLTEAGGGVRSFTFRMIASDQSETLVQVDLEAVSDDDEVVGFLARMTATGLAMDPPVTREPAETADEESRFDALVRHGADVVSIHEPDGRFRYVSPAITQNLGWQPDELVGTSALEWIHPDDADAVITTFVGQLEPGAVSSKVEYRFRHRDGSWRWLEGVYANHLDDDSIGGIVVNAVNITDRKDAEARLREAERLQRGILENVSELIVVIDVMGRIRSELPTGTQVLGYPRGWGADKDVLDFVHPDDREATLELLQDHRTTMGYTEPIEVRIRHADGSWRYCEVIGNNLLDDPIVEGAIITIRDATDRKRGEQLLASQNNALEQIARGEPLASTLGALVAMIEQQADRARAAIVTRDKAGGRHCVAPSLPDDWTGDSDLLEVSSSPGWVTIAEPGAGPDAPTFGWSNPVMISGEDRPMGAVVLFPSERRFPNAREQSVIEHAASLAGVALERVKSEAELAFRATHDPLTGLPTRRVFQEKLAETMADRRQDRRQAAVLFLDLDRFKDVNDGLGHDTGDMVLRETALRIERSLRADDLVARFGGDEFVILANVEGPEHACMVADRLLGEIRRPLHIDSDEVTLSASIGIALPSDTTIEPDELIRNADVAMYRAKQRGRSRAELFDDQMRSGIMARLDLDAALRRAIELQQFRLDYQPVVRIADGKIHGIEALLRWDRDGVLVLPGEFIPRAEDTGLIVPIGRFVLLEACRQSARWRALRPHDPLTVMAINLSARQLAHPGLVSEVAAALDASETDPKFVSLEITESVLLDDLDGTINVLEQLRSIGVRLVIDDFGTGYSSLAYLKRLPVDELKVDRTFVAGLGRDPKDSAIVHAVIELAHALGITVVAEGVETPAQLEELRELGCDFAQGFYLARPQSAEAIDNLLSEGIRLAAG